MRALAIIVAASLLISGAPTAAKSIHAEFSEAWAERDDAYAKDFVAQLETANQAVSEYRSAVEQGRPDDEQAAIFKAAMSKVHTASKARGRGLLLIEFREFIAEKPSAARTELWMQEQVAQMQREEKALADLQREIESLPDNTEGVKIVAAMQSWIEAHGSLSGKLEEIQLIDANLRSYFAGRGEEKSRSRSLLGGLLGGLAAGLRQQEGSFPTLPMPTITRCSPSFSGVICLTN